MEYKNRYIKYTKGKLNFIFIIYDDNIDYKNEYPKINDMFENLDDKNLDDKRILNSLDFKEQSAIILITSSEIFNPNDKYWKNYFNTNLIEGNDEIYKYECGSYTLVSVLYMLQYYSKENLKHNHLFIENVSFNNPLIWLNTFKLAYEWSCGCALKNLMKYFDNIDIHKFNTILYNLFIKYLKSYEVYIQTADTKVIKTEIDEKLMDSGMNAYYSFYDFTTAKGQCPIVTNEINNYLKGDKDTAERDILLCQVCIKFIEFIKYYENLEYIDVNFHNIKLTIGSQLYVLKKKKKEFIEIELNTVNNEDIDKLICYFIMNIK